MESLSDSDIHNISEILSGDTEAVRGKDRICAKLGLRFTEVDELKRRVILHGSGPYSFFTESLDSYRSKNGSLANVPKLIQIFNQLQLQSVVENLQREYGIHSDEQSSKASNEAVASEDIDLLNDIMINLQMHEEHINSAEPSTSAVASRQHPCSTEDVSGIQLNNSIGALHKNLQQEALTPHEVLEFVKTHLKVTNQTIELLVEALHPSSQITLQLAVAYIQNELCENPNAIEDYLKALGTQENKNEGHSEINRIALKVLHVTLEKFHNGGADRAIGILNAVSFFEPNTNIDGTIFSRTTFSIRNEISHAIGLLNKISLTSKLFLDNDRTRNLLDEAKPTIQLLQKYSLLTGEYRSIKVERSIQHVVRMNLDSEETRTILVQAFDILTKFLQDESSEKTNTIASFLPHAVSVWKHSLPHDQLIRKYSSFLSNLCYKLYYYEQYGILLQLTQDSANPIERAFRHQYFTRIQLKYYEAVALYELNESAKSLEILNLIHPLAKLELGIDHRLTLFIHNLIGLNIGHGQGNYTEELRIHEEIERNRLRILGYEHPDTLNTLQHKARALFKLGRTDEALKLFQSVGEVKKKLGLGADTLSSLSSDRGSKCLGIR